MITATVGGGLGAKARVGPVQAGVLFNAAEVGLRGGEIVRAGVLESSEIGTPRELDVILLNCGCENFEGGPLAPERGKTFHAVTAIYLTAPLPEQILTGPATKRKSGKRARYTLVPYWTQIEAVVGIGGSVRLGLNLGEVIDFILGWTTLDLCGDDVEGRPADKLSLR